MNQSTRDEIFRSCAQAATDRVFPAIPDGSLIPWFRDGKHLDQYRVEVRVRDVEEGCQARIAAIPDVVHIGETMDTALRGVAEKLSRAINAWVERGTSVPWVLYTHRLGKNESSWWIVVAALPWWAGGDESI